MNALEQTVLRCMILHQHFRIYAGHMCVRFNA